MAQARSPARAGVRAAGSPLVVQAPRMASATSTPRSSPARGTAMGGRRSRGALPQRGPPSRPFSRTDGPRTPRDQPASGPKRWSWIPASSSWSRSAAPPSRRGARPGPPGSRRSRGRGCGRADTSAPASSSASAHRRWAATSGAAGRMCARLPPASAPAAPLHGARGASTRRRGGPGAAAGSAGSRGCGPPRRRAPPQVPHPPPSGATSARCGPRCANPPRSRGCRGST